MSGQLSLFFMDLDKPSASEPAPEMVIALGKCWSCDRRDFLRQNLRGPAECVSKSHECDHCFVLSDEQYYKQLELTPRMRYDQGMYHGVALLEVFICFEIKERLQRRCGSKKAAQPQQA